MREEESLFEVLITKVAALEYWVSLDCSVIGPAWSKYGNVTAEVIKPQVDEYLHTLFRIKEPSYQKIKLTHNDPRFWDLLEYEDMISGRRVSV